MDTSLDRPSLPAAPQTAFGALPARNKLMLGLGAAALAAVIATAAMWARQPDYRVLFTNLSDRDGGSVVGALSQMNVPYKFSDVGGVIMVPADKVHDARLRLASQGLPKGGTVGFELVETQKFGTTQFQERLNYQRGLEGELARSIMALSQVASARVHLALPTQNGFFREQQKPSASVLLTMHPGRILERGHVAGIVHLIASSIPEMTPKQVSVVDQSGALLSNQDGSQSAGLDPNQLQYLRTIEQNYIARIVEIVEPIVGRGNVKAQVTADVDFTLSESTAEQFRPNQGNEPAAVRSQQVNESAGAGAAAGAQGVPGAMSNQPPVPPTAPINGPGQALPQGQGGAAQAGRDTKRESTTNFEVDKTVRVTRNASGNLKRLTAAVVVNHRRSVDEEGKVTFAPLDPKEVEQIQSLVREAIGFTKDRGDALNVVNAAFSIEDMPKADPIPLWKDPDVVGLARSIGAQVGLVLLGLMAILFVIKPALKRPPPPPAAPRTTAVVGDDVALPTPAGTPFGQLSGANEDIIRLARENPATVANVVRSWVST
ncbi:MAG: flagellar basal body M-ring protein FliF [Burkholderiales bacterium]|nr:MAG: flagellar basal body M-ring protein FliF [Burkholderiales bacterium]